MNLESNMLIRKKRHTQADLLLLKFKFVVELFDQGHLYNYRLCEKNQARQMFHRIPHKHKYAVGNRVNLYTVKICQNIHVLWQPLLLSPHPSHKYRKNKIIFIEVSDSCPLFPKQVCRILPVAPTRTTKHWLQLAQPNTGSNVYN